MKKIIENGGSVQFVMVFERNQIFVMRGQAWKEAVRFLEETFQKSLGSSKNSLCVLITKTQEDLSVIKGDIQKFTPDGSLDLSQFITVYDPLNPDDKVRLSKIINETTIYSRSDVKISVGASELGQAMLFGNRVQEWMEQNLKSEIIARKNIDTVIQKVKFTHQIANLGNASLATPHALVSKVIQDYINDELIDCIYHLDDEAKVFQKQLESYRQYTFLRENFNSFINFKDFDNRVMQFRRDTKNQSWVARQGDRIFRVLTFSSKIKNPV